MARRVIDQSGAVDVRYRERLETCHIDPGTIEGPGVSLPIVGGVTPAEQQQLSAARIQSKAGNIRGEGA